MTTFHWPCLIAAVNGSPVSPSLHPGFVRMNVCVCICLPAAVVDCKTHETGAKQCLPHLEVDRRRQLNQRALQQQAQQAQRVSRWTAVQANAQPCKPCKLLIKTTQSHGYTRTSTSSRTQTCTSTHQSLGVVGYHDSLCCTDWLKAWSW